MESGALKSRHVFLETILLDGRGSGSNTATQNTPRRGGGDKRRFSQHFTIASSI